MKRSLTNVLAGALVLGIPVLGSAALKPGDRAPEFSLPRAGEGASLSLAQERQAHAATVVMFISTRCPVSNAYDERMEALEKDYGAKGVRFIGVNSNFNEPVAEIVSHAREHGFTFPIVKDERSRTADAYGAEHTPEIFVVDRDGVVRYHGRIDENRDDPSAVRAPDLRNALDAMLAGRPVPTAATKAFGCSIKRG
jgi:peroxiredoxin